MHAAYCRLLRIKHAHAIDATTADTERPEPVAAADGAQTDLGMKASGSNPADDNRPSAQMANVPRLLRAGYTIEQTAALTGAPVALVQLVQTEIGHTANGATGHSAWQMDTRRGLRGRGRRRLARAIVTVACANIVTGLIAWTEHNDTLGAASTICAVLLSLPVFFLARARPRRPPANRD